MTINHRWDVKPDRNREHVVICQLCGVTVERVTRDGRFVNFHTLPGQTRARGLAPNCTGFRETTVKVIPVEAATVIEAAPLKTSSAPQSETAKLREIELMVQILMRDLLPVSEYGRWSFRWDFPKARFGQTNYTRRTITLSKPWAKVRTIEETRTTIIHEIAHARCPGVGHGPEWVAMAQSLGIKGERCTSTDAELKAKYEAVCKGCGHVARAHRLTKSMNQRACKACCVKNNGGHWSAEYVLTFIQQY